MCEIRVEGNLRRGRPKKNCIKVITWREKIRPHVRGMETNIKKKKKIMYRCRYSPRYRNTKVKQQKLIFPGLKLVSNSNQTIY